MDESLQQIPHADVATESPVVTIGTVSRDWVTEIDVPIVLSAFITKSASRFHSSYVFSGP